MDMILKQENRIESAGKRSFDSGRLAFNLLAYSTIGIMALVAVIPFYILVVSSFTSEHSILNYGYSFWPREFSLAAYRLVFIFPERILNAYGVSIFVTTVGTALSLFLSSMASYVMYRKDVKYRNQMAFYIYFTTLFSGGLVPYYLLIAKYLHLQNTIVILLITQLFNVLNVLILRNFFKGTIPDSLFEAAKIDGAGDFSIFMRIVLPLSKPALASIGMFTALLYWNDWWTPMMFIQKQTLFPLQYTLYQILSSAQFSSNMVNAPMTVAMPKESLKLALTVVATGPIVLLYPFVQKYFVAGITIGAVKG